MPAATGYYRHPSIHADTIVFVSEDDLWSVPVEGGLARRLTANPGTCSFPALSPDGGRIAFTGRDDGPTEVYVMDAEGGPARRLTWLGSSSQVAAWHPGGKQIVFSSDWRMPFRRSLAGLHLVPVEGGPVSAMSIGPARAIGYQPEGAGVVIGRNSGDLASWKRYRGGTAGTLWIDRRGTGDFNPLIELRGNLASPMWIGGRIYFLSDHEAHGNLYSCLPTGRNLRRHTDHEEFCVRFPSTDGVRIVYHAGADIFVYTPKTGDEHKVGIRVPSTRSQLNRKFIPAQKQFEDWQLHPAGHSLASVHRGGLYAMGLWEGAPSRLGGASGARHRLPTWLPGGKRLVAVTDDGGEESLVVFDAPGAGRGKPRVIHGDFGRAVELAAALAGAERVALTNHRHEIMVIDLGTGRAKTLERSAHQRIAGISWSPDGRWLAYGFPDTSHTSRIHLYEAATGRITPVTRSAFQDGSPAFDPEGRYLYFISYRVFDPVYDQLHFDLGFPRGSRPFLLTLTRDLPSPFSAATREPRAPGNSVPVGAGEKKRKGALRVRIDLDGIADRVVAFPVSEGIYGRIAGTKNRVLFSSYPVEGSLDAAWYAAAEPPAKGTLHGYGFDTDRTETIMERVTDFALSMDAKVLGVRSGNRVRVVPVTVKAEEKPANEEPGRESGWIDFGRLRAEVAPTEEWRQMFREAWRLLRDHYWTPDMAGIDWPAIHRRYLPLVDRASCRSEFSDVLWEMQGELGTSHCYELGGDYRPEPAWHSGFLGADLEFDARRGAWRVTRIPRGDSWETNRSSSLAAPGVNVGVGDEIVAVGGLPVDRGTSPYERLVNLASREVELTVRSGRGPGTRGAGRGTRAAAQLRTVTVKTLADEFGLRYRDWVEANRARVHAASGGRIGYVHVPNMGPAGYAEFHRYYLGEADRDALVIDVRFNGGGHVSQLLLEKLLRRRLGYTQRRWGVPTPFPREAPMGPMVALTNEYAGSDGDIFSHCFKLMGLGPLIGKRTWGGVVGIWPRHSLVDGTITTQPEFAFWFRDVGWGVENYGTDPDIEVEIRPQDYAAGRDPQMDRALAEVKALIRTLKPGVPPLKDRPSRKPAKLPRAR